MQSTDAASKKQMLAYLAQTTWAWQNAWQWHRAV